MAKNTLIHTKKIIMIFSFFIFFINAFSQTPVQRHGQLRVSGRNLVDQNGNLVILRGMSLFWSCWAEGSKYYNSQVINWLVTDWKISVIRAAMGIEPAGGYLSDPTTNKQRVETVINAAIQNGIYVIIDWHDHNAPRNQAQAISFFQEMAQKYGNYPNVIYEIFNEPDNDDSWDGIKNYATAVINAIRQRDPDNVILVGTPNWCQDVDVAANSPISGVSNVMYVLHFYAASHKDALRNKAQYAISRNLPIFVSEFGTCEYTGSGALDLASTETWLNFLEQNGISWVNWSISDKQETSAALQPGASTSGGWPESQLTESGRWIRNKIRSLNTYTSNTVMLYLTSCSSGSIVWATTNVVVNATSQVGISKVDFYLDGNLAFSDTSSPYSWSWNTQSSPDGWHNLKVVAYTVQNTSDEVTTSVIVYNASAPSVNIVNLQNGATIYGTSVAVYVDANKGYEQTINKVELYLNNNKISEDTVAPFSFSINTTQYPDGNATLRAVAYDKRNQQATKQITVYIKNQDDPPTVRITYPQNNTTLGGTVNIQVEATDDRGISRVEFYIDGTLQFTDRGSPYSWSWDTTQYSEGQHSILVIAYDSSNQQAQASITVIVSRNVSQDNPPNVSFVTPQNNQTVSGSINVEVLASDDKGVTKVELYINTTKIAELTAYPYRFTLNTQNYPNGNYTLKAVAIDTANQSSEASIVVNINNQTTPPPQDTPPSVTILSPQNNQTIDKTLSLTVNLSDDKGIISRLQIYLNNNIIAQHTSVNLGTNSYSFDVSSYNNDVYELKVVAIDSSNNSSEAKVNIIINNTFTPPNGGGGGSSSTENLILDTTILENTTVSGIFNFNISAYAKNGISKIEIFINNQPYEVLLFDVPTNNINFNYSLETTSIPDGETQIKITLYDTLNNTTEKSYKVQVENFKNHYICTPNNDGLNDYIHFNANSEIRIYDLKGKIIKTIKMSPKIWDGNNEEGQKVSTGLYIYKVTDGNKILAVGTISVIN